MARFRCYSCRRGSETEREHIGHRCNRFRVWLTLNWRRIKAVFGPWSWYPPDTWRLGG